MVSCPAGAGADGGRAGAHREAADGVDRAADEVTAAPLLRAFGGLDEPAGIETMKSRIDALEGASIPLKIADVLDCDAGGIMSFVRDDAMVADYAHSTRSASA